MEPGLATLGRVARAMSDPRLGILKYFGEAPNLPVAPSLFIATAETIDGIYFQDFDDTARAEGVHTSGAGLTREECMWATLGESMERYAARCCTVDLVTAAAQDVEADAIDVTKIIRFSDAQYDSEGFFYSRFDRDASRRWVWSAARGSSSRRRSSGSAFAPDLERRRSSNPIPPASRPAAASSMRAAAGCSRSSSGTRS